MLSLNYETGSPQYGDEPRGQYDAVFVGGGHNALVCAAYLAQKGISVAVFEARGCLGGMAVFSGDQEDLASHRTDCAHLLKGVPTAVVKDLKLKKYGLAFSRQNIPTVSLDENGNVLRLSHHLSKTLHTLRATSKADADAYDRFQYRIGRLSKLVEPLLTATPPTLKLGMLSDGFEIQKFAETHKLTGDAGVEPLRRWLTDSLGEVLEQMFENDLLKGALAWDGVAGGAIDPHNINSSLAFLYRVASERLSGGLGRAYPVGGMHAFIGVLSNAASDLGVEFFVGRKVQRILTQNGRATGVELHNGEKISARLVISNADPKRTYLDLVGADELETQFVRRLNTVRSRGSMAKIDLNLSSLPEFRGLEEEDFASRIVIAPSVGHLQRAAAALKYNAWSDAPAFEITFPTLLDKTANSDGHVLSCLMQYVPFDVEGGWQAARPRFEEHAIRALAFYAPDLGEKILDYRILLPADIAAEWNNSGGHWHHAELSLDQCASFRPVYGAVQYSGPIENLYLCGAGTHPGGGLTALPGYNAARRILNDIGSLETIANVKG